MLTDRDFAIIELICRYYTLTRSLIQSLLFPNDPEGRITRKRLRHLHAAGFINRTHMEVVNPLVESAPAPVYYPSKKGCELLFSRSGDERYRSICTLTPNWQYLLHWVRIAQFHITLDQAIARQGDVQVEGWLSEWDIANPEEKLPEKRYQLFTLVRESPRLVCAPDAAFLLSLRSFRKVYYLELDRGTSGIAQIAASKTPGYAAMTSAHLRRHFPTFNVESLSVLTVTTTPMRRDLLKKAIAPKDGAGHWKFVAWHDVTPEKLLYDPIFHVCNGEPASLIKPAKGGGP